MNKFLQIGESITYKNETDETIGYHDVVALGTSCIGIMAAPVLPGFEETVLLTGIWELPADSTAFSVGDMLYWNVENKKLTKTDTDIPAGMCTATKTTSATTASVKLLGNAFSKATTTTTGN